MAAFPYKNLAIFGLGKTGQAAITALLKQGVRLTVFDDNLTQEMLEASIPETKNNIEFLPITQWNWQSIEAVLLAPGVPLYFPKPHPVVSAAQLHHCPIISDIELLYQRCPNARYVAITGTNGKSTTTALLGHLLKTNQRSVAVGGNIGVAALSLPILGTEGVYVLEVSSYQIDLFHTFPVNIAILLNITADHIDRHGSMDAYIAAKERLFSLQRAGAVAIIGIDTAASLAVYERVKQHYPDINIIPISTKTPLANGITVMDGILSDCGQEITLPDLPYLAGEHNAQNIACAFAAAKLLELSTDQILRQLPLFKGLDHRMQLVKQTDRLTIVNDSKATNMVAAAKALSTYDNIYWIAGGRAKEKGLLPLEQYFSRIHHAYFIGEAAEDFGQFCKGKLSFTLSGNLAQAVKQAMEDTKSEPDATLLLSPACASFDQWQSFEARGEAFCHLVEEYL